MPEGESWKFYYYAGSVRTAMRLKNVYGEQVYYFFSDHLGSTNVITDPNGNVVTQMMYKAWGEVRYNTGSLPTDYTYTGQRSDMDDLDLMFYNARWYDPQLGRFIQADTIVPGAGSPAAYDRYAYVLNNPIMMNDPSGHCYNYNTPEAAAKCDAYWAAYNKSISDRFIAQGVNKFGVKFVGYTTTQKVQAISAMETMNNSLFGGITQFTFGRTFTFTSDPVHYGGITHKNGNINFWADYRGSPYQNIYHEIAHLINFSSGEFFEDELNNASITTKSGEYVMGGPDENYQRNSRGYIEAKVLDPTGRRVDAQQHAGDVPCSNGWCVTGNTASEEFADLVANLVSGNLASNPSGTARQTWIEQVFLLYQRTQKYPGTPWR